MAESAYGRPPVFGNTQSEHGCERRDVAHQTLNKRYEITTIDLIIAELVGIVQNF